MHYLHSVVNIFARNLPPPLSFSDQSSKIPFCKQHYTGNEVTNVRQALELGLDSSSHFALKCVASILRIVASPCVQRVLMVHSGKLN